MIWFDDLFDDLLNNYWLCNHKVKLQQYYNSKKWN